MVNLEEEGEVVIFACSIPKRTVMLAPCADGAALCPVNPPSAVARESCATAGRLADEVLWQATNLTSQQPRQA